MAHYARDCWDAEIKIFDDWVECVGVADRGEHDLSEHIRVTNRSLTATEVYHTPKIVEKLEVTQDYKAIGEALKGFNSHTKSAVFHYFKNLPKDCAEALVEKLKAGTVTLGKAELGEDSDKFICDKEMLTLNKKKVKVSVNKYVPSVVEPAFGLSRILYALMVHSFEYREEFEESSENDLQKIILKLKPTIAPNSVGVLPLSNTDGLKEMAEKIHRKLRLNEIRSCADSSGAAIGRRYVRMDKAGVPFNLTVDFGSIKDGSITLRERDSCQQVRLPAEVDLIDLLQSLQCQKKSWEDIIKNFPIVSPIEGHSPS